MLTKSLGEKIEAIEKRGAPSEVRKAAKRSLIDTVAVMMAGRLEQPVQIIREISTFGNGSALEVGGFQRCEPETAALINGVAAHVLDYDDVALRGHPGAVMVPALLSLGTHLKAPGDLILDAYSAGYQVWADLVFRDEDIHHLKGWHPTGIFGAIAAAAACSVLLKLNAQAASNAIGLGASMSAGIMANFGSMAKPLHAGRSAQAGVVAARLAKRGFTAGADALEHEQGFLQAVSPNGRVARAATSGCRDEWALSARGLSIKKYPTCYYTHRAIDAVLELYAELKDRLEEITRVEVRISREHATVLRNHAPQDALAAKFSIEFAMACALVHGRVSLFELNDRVVRSDLIQKLMGKVSVSHLNTYSATWKGAADADQVFVYLQGGAVVASPRQTHAKGDAENPLDRELLDKKFIDCLVVSQAPVDAHRLLDRLWNIERAGIDGLWE